MVPCTEVSQPIVGVGSFALPVPGWRGSSGPKKRTFGCVAVSAAKRHQQPFGNLIRSYISVVPEEPVQTIYLQGQLPQPVCFVQVTKQPRAAILDAARRAHRLDIERALIDESGAQARLIDQPPEQIEIGIRRQHDVNAAARLEALAGLFKQGCQVPILRAGMPSRGQRDRGARPDAFGGLDRITSKSD
jgi:hypothetical protein